jgi:CNT family concentrative nucleoside transporter
MTAVPMRLGFVAAVAGLGTVAWFLRESIGPRGQALFGVPCFLLLALALSENIKAINWRTVVAGFVLQIVLAALILKVPAVYDGFATVGAAIQKFVDFSNEGAKFVFGVLTDRKELGAKFGPQNSFIFAVSALPAVIFVSSFFTVLYYLGVLQLIVKILAKGVMYVMGTSGAETLSGVANVFMGQTEAPLIVKPYVKDMTRSELLALMIGGMATISGGVMVAYIGMMESVGMKDGAVSILATSVMAAPCGLSIAKLLVPETETPKTMGNATVKVEREQANVFEAAAVGASEGMRLVINIAAMLIAFIAFVAMFDYLLGMLDDRLKMGGALKLTSILGTIFSPIAFLMGVESKDAMNVGSLLGTKLALNEFVAYVQLTGDMRGQISPRSFQLSVFALTGFANFASIGIQLGGIGEMAPTKRTELAKLGLKALFGGFLATIINATIAGLLMG